MTDTELAWLRLKAFEIVANRADEHATYEKVLKQTNFIIDWALKPESEGN